MLDYITRRLLSKYLLLEYFGPLKAKSIGVFYTMVQMNAALRLDGNRPGLDGVKPPQGGTNPAQPNRQPCVSSNAL